MKFATREQIQVIHGLGSDRNALKVLRGMLDYLHVGNLKGRNVYYLNKVGRDWIGSTGGEVKFSYQIEHYLMRNDLYIYYGCPKNWEIERKVEFKILGKPSQWIKPDARFVKDDIWHFIEIDRTQSMSDNIKKIEDYAQLSPIIEADLKHKPVIVFYTIKNSREHKLKELCKKAQLDCMVYTQADLR